MPTISVVIPTRNGSRTIRQALSSVFAQSTINNTEIIAVDDGSADPTPEILRAYGDSLNLITLPANRGVSAAANEGVRKTQGRYLAFLHDDDDFLPGKLKELLSAMESDPAAVLGFSD